ncbi:hypothetical protein SAMN04488128_101158 [Chitinophaga eiseniae]|uniref:SD-repeat containing protein B domain-containing protein n=2 Tax=Chitinophaga eiseniae TaxID=634771 RepID=A0A1T4KJS9_9BACT|nr:hypothetical protein SAMN04488128_101158 [Chitinophaga eiseniae]
MCPERYYVGCTPFTPVSQMKLSLPPMLCILWHLCCNAYSPCVFGQGVAGFVVTLKDSLAADKDSRFLYNHIRITNKYHQAQSFQLSVTVPEGWRLMSPAKPFSKALEPDQSEVVPVVLMRQQNAPASWKPVQVQIDAKAYRFFVKAEPINEFSVTPITSVIQLRGQEKDFKVTLRVKNTGTVPGAYLANIRNRNLDINSTEKFWLKPGKDTVYSFSYHLKEKALSMLKTEKLQINVEDTAGVGYMHYATLERVQHERTEKASPYITFPLWLETGVMIWGKQVSYYGGMHGEIPMGDNKLSFFYRTKQYGLGNNLERNVLGFNYRTKNWDLYLGHMSDIKYFYSYGNGGKFTYRPKANMEFSISATKHSNVLTSFTNDNITMTAKYPVGKMVMLQGIAGDVDHLQRRQSYLFNNELQLFNTPKLLLSVSAGAGMDFFAAKVPGFPDKPGAALGYNFAWHAKRIDFSSLVQYYSDYFPGLNKGLMYHFHDFSWKFGNNALGAFYQYNRSGVNTLRDTVYSSDAFKFNIAKYGLKYSHGFTNGSFSLSGGLLRQSIALGGTMPDYIFGEMYVRQQAGKKFSFYLNSISGYNGSYGTDKKAVLLTNTNMSLAYRFFGLKGNYMQQPVFDQTSEKNFLRYIQTMLAGPYMTFTLWKKVRTNVYYNFSKSLYDDRVYHQVGGSVMYSNSRKGIDLSASAMVPLESGSLTPNGLSEKYVSISMTKKFNVPLIFRKKYFTLNLLPFFDVNANGTKEAGEQLIPNLQININSIPFISDERGAISYRNVTPGNYKLDFGSANNVRGVVPASGLFQTVPVNKDRTVFIPFKRSRVITGRIVISSDSLAKSNFPRSNIKVIATDSTGMLYSTLTDDMGSYFLNVPAGKYAVSLNPEAFNDKIRPRVMSCSVDVGLRLEGTADFEIVDKSRIVRMFKTRK